MLLGLVLLDWVAVLIPVRNVEVKVAVINHGSLPAERDITIVDVRTLRKLLKRRRFLLDFLNHAFQIIELSRHIVEKSGAELDGRNTFHFFIH